MIFARGGMESLSCKSQVKSQVENFLNKTNALFAKSNASFTTEHQVLCATSNVQQFVTPLFAVVDLHFLHTAVCLCGALEWTLLVSMGFAAQSNVDFTYKRHT